jgi:hypothetical protein
MLFISISLKAEVWKFRTEESVHRLCCKMRVVEMKPIWGFFWAKE